MDKEKSRMGQQGLAGDSQEDSGTRVSPHFEWVG